MAAPIRREAAYLLEWIAYHRALGIETIILGDNGGDDGTSELLQKLSAAGLVHRLDFLGRRFFQDDFDDAALDVARKVTDGIVFIDADEFVRLADPVQNCFDGAYYLDTYPDIRASGLDPVEHFRQYGWRELRNPNAFFETRFYLEKNADVVRNDIDPLLHFETTGWREGRDPSPNFCVDNYLESHPELRDGALCPLDHFLETQAYPDGSRASSSLKELAADWFADPDFGAIGLNWAIYGSGGIREWREGLVIERFQRRAARDYVVNHHVKSLVRISACQSMKNMHAATLGWNLRKPWQGRYHYVNSTGEPLGWERVDKSFGRKEMRHGQTNRVVWGAARIEHFCVKSWEEFENKRGRGAANSAECEAGRFQEWYFGRHDRNDVYDPMPQSRINATRREMKNILAALQ